MSTHLGHPPADAFEPPSVADTVDRLIEARKHFELSAEAKIRVRATIREERAQDWFNQMDELVGSQRPTTADGWNERPELLLRYAQIANIGLDSRAVSRYADYCELQAKVMEPGRFGAKAQLTGELHVKHQVIDSRALTPDQRQAMRELLQAAIVQSALPAPERESGDDRDA